MEVIELKIKKDDLTSVGRVKQVNIQKGAAWLHTVSTIDGPTHNCQMSIIGGYVNIMSLSDEELKFVTQKICKELSLRKIIQLDLNRPQAERIKKLFESAVIKTMDYTSTNGSLMTIILLRTVDI